MRDGGAKV